MRPPLTVSAIIRAEISAWLFIPLYLLLHGVIATCLPERLSPLSTVFIVLAEWGAIAASIKKYRRVRSARVFWLLLIAAIAFHSIAMSLDALTEIARLPLLNHAPALPVLFSMMYGVPLLYAVSLQNVRRVGRVARVTHAILSIAVGTLIYVQIFSFLGLRGAPEASDEILIIRLFDGIDFFLAIAATIRWAGSSRAEERQFFRTLTLFLWMNAVFPAVHNRILIHHDYVALDLLISAPYVVLIPLVLKGRSARILRRGSSFVRTVQSGSPLFHASALVLVAVVASRTHFYLGLITAMVGVVGYGILNVFVQNRGLEAEDALIASKTELEKLVDLDGLTGIANRRAFDERRDREFALALQTGQPVSLLMIDVDRFKSLNDAMGHVVGDSCLIQVAAVLRGAMSRATDFVARYGGEEFAGILPATDRAGAMNAAEKVRAGVANLRLSHPGSKAGILTVSVGAATFDGSAGKGPADLTETADNALYAAKREGRNVVVFLPMDEFAKGRETTRVYGQETRGTNVSSSRTPG